MGLLAQPDVFQPKLFFGLSHRKARLPGDWARVANKMASRENSLRSRFIRWNRIFVVHRIFTFTEEQIGSSGRQPPNQLRSIQARRASGRFDCPVANNRATW
jgi:hypothetical protein